MGLYSVMGIVASANGGRWKRNAVIAFFWLEAKVSGFPFCEGASCGKFEAHSSRPLAICSPLHAKGGAL